MRGRVDVGGIQARSVRLVAAALAVLAAVPAVGRSPESGPGGDRARVASIVVHSVDAVGTTVRDLDRSVRFYTEVLGFELISTTEVAGREWELLTGVFGARSRVATLAIGDERLELTEFLAPRGRDYPADTRANDAWFQHVALVVPDIGAAYARLRARGVGHASTGPQRLPDWNEAAGGINAYYFRDPDGHFLELIQFPPGKGDSRWQHRAAGDRPVGIDHTAIVVADTERALAFYRDGLGLHVAGGAENHGVEQERLNNVFGVRLRITTIRAERGPGVELLEYLAPRTGRPAPTDLAANDLAHWQTTMTADRPDLLLADRRGGGLVSPDVVRVEGADLGFNRGLLVRDPDAHGVRLVAR